MSEVFRLRQLHAGIYLFTTEHQYDLAMYFLRYSEFVESPSPLFRGNTFTIDEYMRWYALERNGANGTFSYPADWAGYNIPKHTFDSIYKLGIPDENHWDVTMRAVYETINVTEYNSDWYLIGCMNDAPELEHELAHALWAIDADYNKEMQESIDQLCTKNPRVYGSLCGYLSDIGYDESVFDDEVHAYLSTGLVEDMHQFFDDGENIKKVRQPFVDVYAKYAKDIMLPWKCKT